jgi:hypothetical protein
MASGNRGNEGEGRPCIFGRLNLGGLGPPELMSEGICIATNDLEIRPCCTQTAEALIAAGRRQAVQGVWTGFSPNRSGDVTRKRALMDVLYPSEKSH